MKKAKATLYTSLKKYKEDLRFVLVKYPLLYPLKKASYRTNILPLFLVLSIIACDNTKPLQSQETSVNIQDPDLVPFAPSNYVCYRTNKAIHIDGLLNETDWQAASNTNNFVDIEGARQAVPPFKSNAKLLWDADNLYIGMTMEEPHLWATLKERDAIIFQDDAFEIFIDPDGDGHQYCEIQVNVFNAVWDLLLQKPFRIDKKSTANTKWDVKGLKTAVSFNGTLNQPKDIDENWTVEVAIPWSPMKEISAASVPPKSGDQWRMNLARVDWLLKIEGNTYQKQLKPNRKKPKQERYDVWSPHGKIDLHQPEMWGYVQFTKKRVGEGAVAFTNNPEEQIKWALWQLHYQQAAYFKKHKKYATSIQELSKVSVNIPNYQFDLTIENSLNGYQMKAPTIKGNNYWVINEEGQILMNGK